MEPTLFAVASPGLEAVLAAEIEGLGLGDATTLAGGVAFRGDLPTLARANLELRSAGRILLRAASFPAKRFDDLRRRAAALAWERWVGRGDSVALRVTCRKSRLWHSGAVGERVMEAIASRLGFEPSRARPEPDDDDSHAPLNASRPRVQLVLVRIENDACTVSVDSSGEPLHRRGYRLAVGRAPLRETLAAGLVLASGWDRQTPLVDPFCGSGTLVIEAALLARGRAPGRDRSFAFEAWPEHDRSACTALRRAAQDREARMLPQPLVGFDRDAGAVEAACANARRAGVEGSVRFERRSVSSIEAPQGRGFVVTNPPHGVRLSRGADLRDLYARFGHVLRERFPGWGVAMLCPDPRLAKASALELRPMARISHGGLRLSIVTGRVPEPG
ncbi:Ribosomal RNA large subunit methyltransferase L [Myxococcaceae bacterium]|nr:Ribosomal RNA large subunit methyltransferase L [Myxococcaceae bacterium]